MWRCWRRFWSSRLFRLVLSLDSILWFVVLLSTLFALSCDTYQRCSSCLLSPRHPVVAGQCGWFLVVLFFTNVVHLLSESFWVAVSPYCKLVDFPSCLGHCFFVYSHFCSLFTDQDLLICQYSTTLCWQHGPLTSYRNNDKPHQVDQSQIPFLFELWKRNTLLHQMWPEKGNP